ncbi:MAG: RNA polymerase sigma factor [Desulfatiglandales bacterium]
MSDAEIVHHVLDGNANAFEGIIFRYGDHVSRIVKKHVPVREFEETIQDVFIRAYQSLSNSQDMARLKQWLSTIAVRTCYDYWRKSYKSREVPMSSLSSRHAEWLEETLSKQATQFFQDEGSAEEAGDILEWALERLSPEDRMVVELVYLEGLSGKEAAALLDWSVANVKVRSFRCRRKLEKILRSVIDEKGGNWS